MRLRKGFEIIEDRRGPGGRIGRGIGVAALASVSSGSSSFLTGLNVAIPVGNLALGSSDANDSVSGTMPASKTTLNAVAFTSEYQFYFVAGDSPNYQEGGKAVRIDPSTYAISNWPNAVKRKATLIYKDGSGTQVVLPITYSSGQSSITINPGDDWQSDKIAFVDHLGAPWQPPDFHFMSLRQAWYFSDDLATTGQVVSHYTYGGNTNYINNTTTTEKYSNLNKYSTAGVTEANLNTFLAGGAQPGAGYLSGFPTPHWITGDYQTAVLSAMFVGDSITAQGFVARLGPMLAENGVKCGIINWSRHTRQLTHWKNGGGTAYDIAALPGKTNILFVCLGPNDVSNGRTLAQFKTDMHDAIALAKAANPNLKVALVPPTPRSSWSGNISTTNQTATANNLDIVRWIRGESAQTPLADAGADFVCDMWWTDVAWGQNSNTWSTGEVVAGSATGKWRVEDAYYTDPTLCTSFGDFTTDAALAGFGGPYKNAFCDTATLDTNEKARNMAGHRVVFTSGANSGLIGQVSLGYKWLSGVPTYSNGQYSLSPNMANDIAVGTTGKIIAYHSTDFVHPATWCHTAVAKITLAFLAARTAF